MESALYPLYQPIFQLNEKMLGIQVFLERSAQLGEVRSSYTIQGDSRLFIYRQSLLQVLLDLQIIQENGVDVLFIEIDEFVLDFCRDVFSWIMDSCKKASIELVLLITAIDKAENLDMHPFVKILVSRGAKIGFANFGCWGNNFMQIVTVLPEYIFLAPNLIRWCADSNFTEGFKGIISLLNSLGTKVVVCEPETGKQLQMTHQSNAQYVRSKKFFAPSPIKNIFPLSEDKTNIINVVA